MTVAYCLFHNKYLDADEFKAKSCRMKSNSGRKCRHLIILGKKPKYRNDSQYISTKR